MIRDWLHYWFDRLACLLARVDWVEVEVDNLTLDAVSDGDVWDPGDHTLRLLAELRDDARRGES